MPTSRRVGFLSVVFLLGLWGAAAAEVHLSTEGELIFVDGFADNGTRGWSITVPPTCTDGAQSGDETGVDCGGASCPACPVACQPRPFGEIGGPCDLNGDCGIADSACYVGAMGSVVFAPEGYCRVDDFSLPAGPCVNDADCEAGTICVEWLDFAGYRSCMPACACPGNACPANQACQGSFNGFPLDTTACTPGRSDALDGDDCDGFFACNEYSSCTDDFEHPAGECARYACTVGDDTTCNGGHCVARDPALGPGTTCVDSCTVLSDCRSAEGYLCFDPDGGGSAPNFCRHPHVGDPCSTAADCGGGAWACSTGSAFPGGYCTMTGCPTPGSTAGCTAGSFCYDPLAGPNYCADRCVGAGQGSCRSGYACMDTDPGAPVGLACVPL